MSFNQAKLRQARRGINNLIQEDPEEILITRLPMKDDGFNGEVEDPNGVPEYHNYTVRLSHEKKLDKYAESSAGMSTNLARFITVDWKTIIYVNDKFTTSYGKEFKVGPVDPLKKFNGIIGYQAPLIEAIDLNEGS